LRQYNGRVIEFVGLPGAGKTTTLNELISTNSLAGLGYSIETDKVKYELTLIEKARRDLVALVKQHQEFLMLVRYCSTLGKPSLEMGRFMLAFLRMKAEISYEKSKRTRFDIQLQDQGLCQLFASMVTPGREAGYDFNQSTLTQTISNSIDGVVFFDIPIETSFIRIRERSTNTSRFDNWSDDVCKRLLPRYEALLNSIVEGLAQEGVRVLYVDSTRSVATNAAQIEQWVRELPYIDP